MAVLISLLLILTLSSAPPATQANEAGAHGTIKVETGTGGTRVDFEMVKSDGALKLILGGRTTVED